MKKWLAVWLCVLLASGMLTGCGERQPPREMLAAPFALTGEYDWCGERYTVALEYRGPGSATLRFLAPTGVSGMEFVLHEGRVTEEMLGIVRERDLGSLPEHAPVTALCALLDAAAAGGEAQTDDDGTTTIACGRCGSVTLRAGVPHRLSTGKDGITLAVTGFERL